MLLKMKCKICNNDADIVFKAKILNKYDVDYYKCSQCSFVQTENPYWLEESYSNAITQVDIGLANRNYDLSKKTSLIINTFFNRNANFIDFAGGYGLLVRLMRDNGFNFFRQDKYCENLFAQHFDITDARLQKFELATAFEVFEHLVNPMQEIDEILSYTDSILFSTVLQPALNINPSNWWYISPEIGQHIALYHYDSLKIIAQIKGLNLYSDGKYLHLLTKKKINSTLFKILCHNKIANFLSLFSRNSRNSLVQQDYKYLKNKIK
jgi:hypothetical protein